MGDINSFDDEIKDKKIQEFGASLKFWNFEIFKF